MWKGWCPRERGTGKWESGRGEGMFLDSDGCGAAGSKSCGQEPGIFPSFLVPDLLIRGGTIAGFSLLPCAKGCHRPGQSPGPGPGHPAPGGPGAGVAEEGRAPSGGRRVPTEDQAGALRHTAPGGREFVATLHVSPRPHSSLQGLFLHPEVSLSPFTQGCQATCDMCKVLIVWFCDCSCHF